MKRTLMLFLASTALGASLGAPILAAPHGPANGDDSPMPVVAAPDDNAPLILASGGDDDNRRTRGRGDDDDDDDDEDDECDDDDDGGCRGGAPDPAPAGSVAPPQNGLFGTGAPPQVRVN